MSSELAPKPFQFSVRHLLALMLGLCVTLALVTQLRNVGLVAAICLVGIGVGAWRRDWRLAAASGTALLIFVVTYGTAWIEMRREWVLSNRGRVVETFGLSTLARELCAYSESRGRFPAALDDAPGLAQQRDNWGNPYQYRKLTDGFELASFGEDGKPGGTDAAADIRLVFDHDGDCRQSTEWLSLAEFIFDTPISDELFIVAALASFGAAGIWYATQPRLRRGVTVLIVSILVTTIAAVIVAVFLAWIHLVLEQASGH